MPSVCLTSTERPTSSGVFFRERRISFACTTLSIVNETLRGSALFSFSLGGHIMDDPALLYTDTDGETAYQSIGIQQLDRWQKPGDITDVPRRINSYQYARYGSSRHMKSSNHLRLKTVTLSYNLPSKWMQAAGMRNARIFASGNNLLTWAAYKNIDPEQPVNGVATWALPNLKSVTFGIEIGL